MRRCFAVKPVFVCAGAGESIAWPTEGWQVRPLHEDARARPAFQELESYLFPPDFHEQARSGVRTDGIVVIQGDALVYERYGRGYTAEMAHPAWSVTKALVDALYGVAVQDGLLAIDDPVAARSDVLASEAWGRAVEAGRWPGEVRPFTTNRRHVLAKVI